MASGISHLVGLEWEKYIYYVSATGRTFLNGARFWCDYQFSKFVSSGFIIVAMNFRFRPNVTINYSCREDVPVPVILDELKSVAPY